MAFTGSATVLQVTDSMFRITGLSLAGAAVGTIGFSNKSVAADVSITAPTWQPFKNALGGAVSLQAAVHVTMVLVGAVTTAVPIQVVKTGTTHADFVITLTNSTVATASPEVEIWVQFHQ